jgi:hypothetical protein
MVNRVQIKQKRDERRRKVVITKRKMGIGMMLIAAVLIISILVPTIASAYTVTTRNIPPWRGSWAASIYVYGKGETQANDFTASWIKVTTDLQKYEGGWVSKAQASQEKNNATLVSATARTYNPGSGTFRTHTFHQWYWPNGSYAWVEIWGAAKAV